MQRMPQSSTRPRVRDAPRCGQSSSSTPTSPSPLRKTTKFSPSSRSKRGAPPGTGTRSDVQIGSQKRRKTAPIGVSGPIRHRRSFSVRLIMALAPFRLIHLPGKKYLSSSQEDVLSTTCPSSKTAPRQGKIACELAPSGRPRIVRPRPRDRAPASMARTSKRITSSPAQDIAASWARERPDLDPLDYLLPIYLIRIGRIVDRVGDRKWQRLFGLSASEIRVLFALRRSGGDYARRPTDLFKALLVTSGAITKKIDRLTAV